MADSLLPELSLCQIDGIGSVMFRHLLNQFGNAQAVFDASISQLMKIPNLGKITISKIKNPQEYKEQAHEIFEQSVKNGIEIISFKSDNYPKRLKTNFDAPPILFFKGNANLSHSKTLAIVGTRDASDYGKQISEAIVQSLVPYDVQIISGLAYGIDVAAHKAALKNNLSTIAVMATSIDKIYPASHKKIAHEITNNGMLLSETPIGQAVVPAAFIARNRIIAAMSDAVIVVESAKKGGSMVTAEFANNYNKEVFAIPGRLDNKTSEGPNYLIGINKAQIYTIVTI